MRSLLLLLLPALALTSCGSSRHTKVVSAPLIEPVSVEIEVFDPLTDGVWVDACVQVIEAYFEDGDVVIPTARPDLIFKTDDDGRVFFSPLDLADVQVGFFETTQGEAFLEQGIFVDEAIVTIEVFGAGFPTVRRDVSLSFNQPFAFAAIPWEPLAP